MLSNKVLITYKRKRLSANASPANVVKADSFVKTTGEHCIRCCSVDVNENLLVCHSCSGSYHLRCVDSPFKYVPEERWLCSHCIKRCNFEVSIQYQPQQTGKITENKNVGESEKGTMKLCSQKVMLSTRPSEDNSRMESPSPVDTSSNKINNAISTDNLDTDSGTECRFVEETPRSQSTNLETVKISSPACLNTWTQRNTSSRFQEDCVSVAVNLDKKSGIMWNDDYPKENYNTSLITFHRRVKKKQDMNDASITRNLKAKDKQSSVVTGSCQELGDSSKFADPTVLLKADEGSSLHAVQQDMNDVRKNDRLEHMHTGQGAADKCEAPCLQRPDMAPEDDTLPSQPSENVLQCQSNKSIGMPTDDAIKDLILLHNSKESGMAYTDKSIRKEKENELVPKERGNVSESEILGAPTVSAYLTNSKSSKPRMDVMAENILESQSSSTQNCALVMVDEETDGRAKELRWLETLDKALMKTKEINSSNFMEKSGINCRLASTKRASPMNPINSSAKIQLSQDVSKECSQVSFHERLTKPDNPTYEKQQHKRASNYSSMYTDFLDIFLPLNSEVPEVSVNNSRSMSLPLDLSIKDTVDGYNRRLRWHSVGEHSSVCRPKQLLENNLIGSQMLKENTLPDKFKRLLHEWSEEELDCLWIGVRRHGLNNWNTILKDPKLCFSKSRVAEDLAEWWDKEQTKLLNDTLFRPVRPSTSGLSGPLGMDDTCWGKASAGNFSSEKVVSSAHSEFPTLKAETKLSLGDVYIPSENDSKRNLPHLSGLSIANTLANKNPTASPFIGSNLIGSTNPRAGIRHQKALKTQYTRYDCESSTSHQKSVARVSHEHRSPAKTTLPHWLKDVLIMPQRQSSLPLSQVSSFVNSTNMINNAERVTAFSGAGQPPAPPKDSCGRGILKRKSMTSSNTASGLKASDNSVSVDDFLLQKNFSLLPNLRSTSLKPTSVSTGSGPSHGVLDLNKTSSDPVGPSNLVVIDSDASSEETISDDQNSRW